MTFGEYYYHVKYAINLQNGKWITDKPRMVVPKQMSKEDAIVYYKAKFDEYWKKVNKNSKKL
ncbi:MAG: hypothetical protein L3J19_02500 [Sulfurimonas sp.]|nr:hypothetical protein [Sulfurimonas sp.]